MSRWTLSPEEIEHILASHGLAVRAWGVNDAGVFTGATVEGNQPEVLANFNSDTGSLDPLSSGLRQYP
jgi:hypothetical protein